jgi:hypothetical protein
MLFPNFEPAVSIRFWREVGCDDRVNAMAPDRRASLIVEFERNIAALVA